MNRISTQQIKIGSLVNQELTLPLITIGKERPSIGIVGGIHGNEPESLFIMRDLVKKLRKTSLPRTVKLLPGANPLALIKNTREGAFDTLDLNRSFPGNSDGSLTERIAHAIFREFENCEIVFDIHSIVNHGHYMGMEMEKTGKLLEKTRDINRLLAPPYIWRAIEGAKFSTTFSNALLRKGVCGVAIELPRLEFLDEQTISKVSDGLLKVIQWPKSKSPPKLSKPVPIIANERRFMSDRGGLYTPIMELMDKVKKGQPVGILTDPTTMSDTTLRSNWSGVISTQSTRKLVRTGDKLYVVGEEVGKFE